ncbi:MAG TPA: nucleotidyltransferase domain-containing protein [Myxococcaceae bacterium]|nr:nucleotidyltransferase domain-containing protein [Myxococcaceae bacterium]
MKAAAQEYVDELAARQEVSAVILFGSQARGDSRPNSDVDLVVLVPSGYRRAVDEREGQAFELLFLSEDVARGYFRQNLDTAAEFWASAQILFERDGVASRLRAEIQEVLAAGKPPLDEGTLTSSRFNSEDQLRAVEVLAVRDAVTAEAMLHNKVLELTGSYFDVRQRWTPSLKTRISAIAEAEPELHARLTAFYAATFQEKLALAREMIPLVYEP